MTWGLLGSRTPATATMTKTRLYTPEVRKQVRTEVTLQWLHNGSHGVSNHQPHHCLLNRLFRHKSKKTSKFRVTGLCAGNSPVTGEFSAQMASNAENVSIWWRHHANWLMPVYTPPFWRHFLSVFFLNVNIWNISTKFHWNMSLAI